MYASSLLISNQKRKQSKVFGTYEFGPLRPEGRKLRLNAQKLRWFSERDSEPFPNLIRGLGNARSRSSIGVRVGAAESWP